MEKFRTADLKSDTTFCHFTFKAVDAVRFRGGGNDRCLLVAGNEPHWDEKTVIIL